MVIALAATAALVVVAAGIVGILSLTGSDDEPRLQTGAFTAPAPAETSTTVTQTRPPSKPSGESASNQFVRYESGTFTAQRPKGWVTESDARAHSGYLESRWRNPDDSNTSVTIDWSPGDRKSAMDSAADVRAQTKTSASYRELTFKRTNLGGRQAVQWVFEVSGDRRVGYFITGCGTAYAVLGSTSPATYERYNGTFRAVARSVAIGLHC